MVELYRYGKLLIRPPELSENLPAAIYSKAQGSDEGNYEFPLTNFLFHTSKCCLTFRKILRRGADGFTSPSKEGELRIFIALINPSLQPGYNPQTFGPITSTLTTITTPK
jgi:hypothetical protein